MKEEKVLKKQLIKNMLWNLAAFSIIFSLFGIFLFIQVSNNMYQSADKELLNSKNRIGIMQNFNHQKEENTLIEREEIKGELAPPGERKQFRGENQGVNPRIIYVIRSEKGELKEEGNLQRMDEDLIASIHFDASTIDTIYRITLQGGYQYRGINYQSEQEGETVYVQMLINVDAEEMILHNFLITLAICFGTMILLSIGVSYMLSRHTLKPIVQSWEKQTEFVQNASHELRTPLTIIQAKQELLLEKPEQRIMDEAEQIHISLKETKRLGKLVTELMALARVDAEQEKLHKELINLDELIKEASIPYQDFAKAQQKEWMLELNFNNKIMADKGKLHQLLVILFDNSIKYTRPGDSIEIVTKLEGRNAIIEIKDTGIGISEETKNHMFERFYREDKARSRETGGSGLGLSIANYIVESHGGKIKAQHNEPNGTIVIVSLPT